MGRSRRLGYGEGSVYKEAVPRASGEEAVIYRGEITVDGKRRRVSGSTRREALKKLDDLRSTSAAGLPTGDDTRLGKYLDWYATKVVSKKHPNTQSNYVWAFKQLEPLRGKRLRELTPIDVETLLEQLADREPTTRAQKRRGGRTKPLGKNIPRPHQVVPWSGAERSTGPRPGRPEYRPPRRTAG